MPSKLPFGLSKFNHHGTTGLIHVSIYRGSHFGDIIFDPLPLERSSCLRICFSSVGFTGNLLLVEVFFGAGDVPQLE